MASELTPQAAKDIVAVLVEIERDRDRAGSKTSGRCLNAKTVVVDVIRRIELSRRYLLA